MRRIGYRVERVGPLVFALVFGLAGSIWGCGGSEPSPADSQSPGNQATPGVLGGRLTVFAAASLTDAFAEIGAAFEAAHPNVDVEFNFAGSSALRAQIEEGAPADVFASASLPHMDGLVNAGLAADSAIFVHNYLVVIVPSDNPGGIRALADLDTPGIKLVLAAEEVPAGAYAREMLANADAHPQYGAGFSRAVLENLVSNESNVKQVVAKVQLGEADAGIVYGSDVTPDVAPSLQTFEIPEALNVIAGYPIATLTESDNPGAAAAFVAFVLSEVGQEILAQWGFSTV